MGPGWSAAMSIGTVLMSIQSLMNDNPYYNEPGLEQENPRGAARRYNELIRHEALRVAVCDIVESCLMDNSTLPQPLREAVFRTFMENYSTYKNIACSRLELTGRVERDPLSWNKVTFQYKSLLKRLEFLWRRVQDRNSSGGTEAVGPARA
ncbi:ubiquitin-conjugating enzyme E2 Z-like isoform X2 [Haemaphysalis longicornis]